MVKRFVLLASFVLVAITCLVAINLNQEKSINSTPRASEPNILMTKNQCFTFRKCPKGKTALWENNSCICKKVVCMPGKQKCNANGAKLQECVANGSGWKAIVDCAHGCSFGECIKSKPDSTDKPTPKPTLKKCGGYGQPICPE